MKPVSTTLRVKVPTYEPIK